MSGESIAPAPKTFTCIARCGTCKAELNRATGVPEADKGQVTLSAPLMAICKQRSHNSLSDVNWNVKLEWIEEPENGGSST